MKKVLSLLSVLTLVGVVSADNISYSWTPTNNDTITGSRYKGDRNAVKNVVNGNLTNTNIKSTANIAQSKLDSTSGWISDATGAIITNSPYREIHSPWGVKFFINDSIAYDNEFIFLADSTDTMVIWTDDSLLFYRPAHFDSLVEISDSLKVVDIRATGNITVGTSDDSRDAGISLVRTLTGSGNSHGFSDQTTFAKDAATAYAPFEATGTTSGATNYDHIAAFQANTGSGGSGTLTTNYSFYSAPVTNSTSTTTNTYGLYLRDVSGTGTATNQYGVYVENLDGAATNNYSIYSGTAQSYLNGKIGIMKDVPDHALVVDAEVADTASILVGNTNSTQGNGNYGASIAWTINAAANGQRAKISSVQTDGDADRVGFAIFTHPSETGSAPPVEQVRIDHNGSVGIDTTTPRFDLHVNGDAKIQDSLIADLGIKPGGNSLITVHTYKSGLTAADITAALDSVTITSTSLNNSIPSVAIYDLTGTDTWANSDQSSSWWSYIVLKSPTLAVVGFDNVNFAAGDTVLIKIVEIQ